MKNLIKNDKIPYFAECKPPDLPDRLSNFRFIPDYLKVVDFITDMMNGSEKSQVRIENFSVNYFIWVIRFYIFCVLSLYLVCLKCRTNTINQKKK